MLRPPPVPLRPSAPHASPLPPPRAANPNTNTTTTTSAAAAANMGAAAWWRRALGQRFNPAGVAAVATVAASEPRLALPHVTVQDIRWLDWAELRRAGFRGVVFDKDNTLTAPYAPALWPPLAAAFDQCRATFPPGALAIYSNSAGLKEYDPDGVDARAIETAIEGVHVIRHGKCIFTVLNSFFRNLIFRIDTEDNASMHSSVECRYKETWRSSEGNRELLWLFGLRSCDGRSIVMGFLLIRCISSDFSLSLFQVGDRYFTDVVYGNRNGFLTVLTEPLSFTDESYIVKRVCFLFGPI
ncbi:hypothetical protein HU200_000298 [Digitaria exilis]|uniref:Uncharacterized protein n=1 Tax=Digitaria exilis TaxID=1010633 RepID=A0A835KYM8_9POAL|nr:hypothetical protein HU200_000298 [Digitaria exilis]